MSKHTLGPWYAKGTAGHDRHGQSAVYGDDGHDVAIVYDGSANAELIAAAPDLLSACKEITRVLDALGWANVASDWPVVTDACKLARAAIVKAEGKSHE